MLSKLKVFMIMPFDPEFNDLYGFIRELVEKQEYAVFRADDLLNQQNILKDVVVSIHDSDLIIADLTGLNPNVFYELGVAHAFRKNVILLTQDISELPFDLRSYRVVQYSTNFTKIKELEVNLTRILAEVKEGGFSFGSPVTDWIPFEKLSAVVEIAKPREHTEIIAQDEIQETSLMNDEILDQKGLLDFLADLDNSMIELTGILNDLTAKTQDMSSSVGSKAEEIQSAWARPSAGTASYVRKLARKTAEIMNNYGLSVSKKNKEYEVHWNVFEESVIGLIDSPAIFAKNREGANQLIDTLESLQVTISSSKEGINAMSEGFSQLNGIEASITRAVNLIEREIKTFAGLMDKSVATLERIISIGHKRIRN